jgi:hypothetical protein
MADIPNTRFFDFVDTPASIHYSQFNEAQVPLDPKTGDIIDVTQFRTVSMLIGSTKATSFSLFMGKISGATLSQEFNVPIDEAIHTFDVIGPEITLFLKNGNPNSDENVQLWVYLRS